MQNNNRIFGSISPTLLALACIAAIAVGSLHCGSKGSPESRKAIVVVELFTSEGCEYCPPAHELLAKIQKENPTKEVYALAYHVDFWDRKKWKDRFSNAQFSRRQISYAEWLNVPTIYAPQIVVNGKREFIGTDSTKIRKYINESLTIRSKATLSIQASRNQDKLTLNYHATGGSENSRLHIAIIKKFSDGRVEEGKHRNHLFTHVQTVRGFHSESLAKDGKGSTTINLPQGFDSKDWEVIAMIQNLNNNGEISTATRVSL
jgi:hypothetical protein